MKRTHNTRLIAQDTCRLSPEIQNEFLNNLVTINQTNEEIFIHSNSSINISFLQNTYMYKVSGLIK
jgi:hypothetical protein